MYIHIYMSARGADERDGGPEVRAGAPGRAGVALLLGSATCLTLLV